MVSGQPVYSLKKALFGHDDVVFCALILTPDKPARFRRHAQIKRLADTGRIDMQGHNACLSAIPELLWKKSDATVAVLQPDGGDVITSYAAVQAVAHRAQVM